MSDFPLTITSIFEHGTKVHGESEVATWTGEGLKRTKFREIGLRVKRLARALARLGIAEGDRVGTLCWNTQEHLEAYYAVSCMGAVIHTLNLRLFPEQLAFIINHGGDRIMIVDAPVVPLLMRIAKDLRTVEKVIVVGEAAGTSGGVSALRGLAGSRRAGSGLADARRTIGGGDVLHHGDYRRPQGRGVQPPVHLSARYGGVRAVVGGAYGERSRAL